MSLLVRKLTSTMRKLFDCSMNLRTSEMQSENTEVLAKKLLKAFFDLRKATSEEPPTL